MKFNKIATAHFFSEQNEVQMKTNKDQLNRLIKKVESINADLEELKSILTNAVANGIIKESKYNQLTKIVTDKSLELLANRLIDEEESEEEKYEILVTEVLFPYVGLASLKSQSETIHGELIRALIHLTSAYFYCDYSALSGYGVKRIGNFLIFLLETPSLPKSVRSFVKNEAQKCKDADYHKFLLLIAQKIVDYIASNQDSSNDDDAESPDYSPYDGRYSFILHKK